MVITTPSAICSSLKNISPEEIFLTGLRYATAWYEGRLYLCLLRHDADHDRYLRRVLRWDPETGHWTDLYSHSVSFDQSREKALPADTATELGTPLSAEIAVAPRFNGVESIQFVFQSPHSSHCLKFTEAKTGDFTVEARVDTRSAARFLHWQVHGDMIFAVVEQTEGSKSLIRATIEKGNSEWEQVPCPDMEGYVSGVISFGGQLLVAVDNERRGFGLWRLVNGIRSGAEPIWEPVLLAGAGRYLFNANVQTLAVWEDSLYVVTGISKEEIAGKYKRKYQAGGFELLRLHEDWDWDLIIGTPRFSSQGTKVPLAEGVFEEWLTPSFSSFLAGSSGLFLCAKSELGFQAWTSSDGERWKSAWSETVTFYQDFSLVAAYDTTSGPVLVAETCDFGNHRQLVIWQGSPAV